ncbi:MAG TPA: hypothetical protein VFF73_05225 [Planctomycetota bacterium]|nr:hypothetical protein [Planctomycetota bacterium]
MRASADDPSPPELALEEDEVAEATGAASVNRIARRSPSSVTCGRSHDESSPTRRSRRTLDAVTPKLRSEGV